MENDRTKKDRKKSGIYVDFLMLLTVLVLIAIGMVMQYSIQAFRGSEAETGIIAALGIQFIATILGLAVMIAVAFVPIAMYKKVDWIWYLIGFLPLFLLFTPLAKTENGATRWLNLFGVSVQVAEISKIAMMFFYATFLCKIKLDNIKGFLIALFTPAPMFLGVLLISNNLSSAIIIYGICVVMLCIACPKKSYVFGLIAIIVLAFFGLLGGILLFLDPQDWQDDFRILRVFAWADPESYSSGKGYQVMQALYAIGSGGLFGKGIGKSIQKLEYMPEAENDMIFAILCEELGAFGGFVVLVLFAFMIFRFLNVVNHAKDLYSALLATGIMAHFSIQVVLNIAVATNLIPNTGVSLPFISDGGSAMVFLLIEVGLMMAIAREGTKRKS